jgi:4-aminobutyrate aminotransferase-like enzyme
MTDVHQGGVGISGVGAGAIPGLHDAETSNALAIARELRLIGPGLPKAVLWTELAISHGDGPYLFDLEGSRFLDMMGAGGVNSIGHAHPAVAGAISEQAHRFTVGSFPTEARARLLNELCETLPPEFDAIQLYSGGTEAVEAALRLAASATGKTEFLSFWGGFHGKTLGSAALTTNGRNAVAPLPGGFFNTPYASATTNNLSMATNDYSALCTALARETVRQNSSGRLAAVIIEPVQGRSGNIVPDPAFMAGVDRLARENNALLISDESMTGFGRTGLDFGFQHFPGMRPDVLIVGKAMGGGYPVTAVISRRELMSRGAFGEPSASSSSFGGFPVACAAAAATLEVIRCEQLAQRAAVSGSWLLERLRADLTHCPIVADIRGLGLAVGVELVDRPTADGTSVVERVFRELVLRGLLVMIGGTTLRLYPPLNIGAAELDFSAEVLAEVLTAIAASTC